jgi:hypothetical protein
VLFVLLLIAAAAAVVVVASWDQLRVWIPALNTGVQDRLAPPRAVQEPLIVPLSSETILHRARAHFESGRVYDALRAVDAVRPTDPLRAEADKLKAEIQLRLLTLQTSPGGAPPSIGANPPQ